MKRGKFIVIEGTDGSGKATQTKLLIKRLKEQGKELLVGDFPRYYSSEWGKLVARFLRGEFGKLNEVDPHLAVLPFMMDQYTWSRDVAQAWINKGGLIVSDRYFTSNVHNVAKLKTRARKKYRDWLWRMGYQELGILKPDLILFLDVPPRIAKKLNCQKDGRAYLKDQKQDIAERDLKHQEASYREYLRHVKLYPEWTRVRCTTKGKLDSIDKIHQRVWNSI